VKRRAFLTSAGLTAGALALKPLLNLASPATKGLDFPCYDLHVHMASRFSIRQIMDIARERDVRFGIVEHPAPGVIKNDTDLKNYIERLRQFPVLIGLQPMQLGWAKRFSPDLLAQVDYVLMDPQTVPLGNGEFMHIWEFSTYVEDTDEFMERYMAYSLQILRDEPINIFGWPLFLPVCIARDYYALWTEDRMQQLISAAKKRNIAFEINDMSHTPHEKFIRMAKEQGLKFTFGSDARNENAGRLAYCKQIARKCNLLAEDFYIPAHKTGKIG
jgi:histidinol phosphatase-like PHP family hydrolase